MPLTGVRTAELIESPIMLVVTWLAARRVLRLGVDYPLAVGLLALALLLCAESVYLVLLGVFAAMPSLLARGRLRK